MEKFKKQVTDAVGVLKKAYGDIENIMADPELIHLRNRLLRVIDKEVSTLSLQHGLGHTSKTPEAESFPPLTKIMGRVISKPAAATEEKQLLSDKPAQEKPTGQSAEEVEAAEFKEKTLELYGQFTDIADEAIVDQFEEMVVRGVGKLAGLPVTENHPKKVDVKFVQEIKDAIKKKGVIEDAAKKEEGTGNLNPDKPAQEKPTGQTANKQADKK